MRKHFHLISPQPPSPRSWLNVTVETAGKQRCLCWVFTRHTPAQTRDQREGWWPVQRERRWEQHCCGFSFLWTHHIQKLKLFFFVVCLLDSFSLRFKQIKLFFSFSFLTSAAHRVKLQLKRFLIWKYFAQFAPEMYFIKRVLVGLLVTQQNSFYLLFYLWIQIILKAVISECLSRLSD